MFVMILQRIYFSINHNFAATRSLFDHLKVDDQIWDFKLFLFIHSFGNHFLNHKIRLQSVLDLRWRRFEWIYICPHSSNQVRSKVTGGSGRLTFGSRRWSLFQTRIAPNVYPTSYGTSFETVLKLQRFFKGEKQSHWGIWQMKFGSRRWSLFQTRTLPMFMSIQHLIQHLLKQF